MLAEVFSNWWPVFVTTAVMIGGALAPLLRSYLERLMGFKFDRNMEDYRYDLRNRERAAKAAEWLALAWQLEASDSKEMYGRVNQLGWEMAMYLPEELYLEVRDSILGGTDDINILTAVIAIRKHLLGKEAGNLNSENIAFHAPNAAKYQKIQ